MFRYFLSVTFAVCLATAAIISTSATCDGVTTTGTISASCNNGRSSASAGGDTGGLLGPGIAVQAGTSFPNSASASVSFFDQYVVTVSGGTGGGLFLPCFRGDTGHGTLSVHGFVAGNGFPFSGPFSGCFGTSTAFTFGVSQIFSLSMVASLVVSPPFGFIGQQGQAAISFIGLELFDPAQNFLPNASATLVAVPELQTWSLLCVGLMFFMVLADPSNAPSWTSRRG